MNRAIGLEPGRAISPALARDVPPEPLHYGGGKTLGRNGVERLLRFGFHHFLGDVWPTKLLDWQPSVVLWIFLVPPKDLPVGAECEDPPFAPGRGLSSSARDFIVLRP